MTPRCSHCSEPFDVEDNARPSPQGEAPPAPVVSPPGQPSAATMKTARLVTREVLRAYHATDSSGAFEAIAGVVGRALAYLPIGEAVAVKSAPVVSEELVELVAQAISRRAAGLISDVFAGQLARAAIAAMSPQPTKEAEPCGTCKGQKAVFFSPGVNFPRVMAPCPSCSTGQGGKAGAS